MIANELTGMANELEKFGRLIVVMEDWATWCERYSGIKSQSCAVGLTSGHCASKSFEDLLESIENDIARLVDAAVDDLEPGQRAAINRRYGMTAVFRFPRGNYHTLLMQAHETLCNTLPKKGVVI